MERYTLCDGCKCAKLTIHIEGESTQTFVSNAPSLIVEIEETSEVYKHEMKTPIDKNFLFEVGRVELVEGVWYYGQDLVGTPLGKSDCPMPGTYPVVRAGDVSEDDIKSGLVTDLYWQKNVLSCYFDKPTFYKNNSGFCTYEVFSIATYKFSDRRGILYQKSIAKDKLNYTIDCDDCCKDTEIMCDSHRYPGYECYPIPPVNRQLEVNRYDLSRLYK